MNTDHVIKLIKLSNVKKVNEIKKLFRDNPELDIVSYSLRWGENEFKYLTSDFLDENDNICKNNHL